jgi:hypothetical protein
MRSILVPVNHLFDFALRPFHSSRPIVPLALISLATAILLLFFFRYASNQPAIRRAKDKLEAHVLEVRLFQEQLRAVLRAYGRLVLGVANYLRLALRPLAWMAIPLLVIIVQLESFFAWSPNRVGDDFLLKAKLADRAALELVELQVPEGLAVTAPLMRIPDAKEADWRLRAKRPGRYSVAILVAGATFSKEIAVSNQLVRISPERSRAGWLNQLLNPSEAQLPQGGPIESIEVQYPARDFQLWGFAIDWMIVYLALSLAAGFALKGVFGIEI